MKDKFVKTDLRQYDCTYIESYFYDNGTKINTDGLVLVDNDLCKKLFGDYKNEFGKLCGSYLFSIDRPVHKLFPITIIQGFGVVERPLVLVLFNENGEVVNSLEVADLYGEGGECLNSVYINDSTLVQSWELSEFGYDSISDKDIWETTYVKSEVTITSKGEFIDKELSRRTIIRTE
jgi:hypothetical protein